MSVLTPETQPVWGKISAMQMLAHLNVSYDLAYKKIIVGEKSYSKNSRTEPIFIIAN